MNDLCRKVSTLLSGIFVKQKAQPERLEDEVVHSADRLPILDAIGATWRCWRLSGETERMFAFRLALHLETIGIAIEDDLELIVSLERQSLERGERHD